LFAFAGVLGIGKAHLGHAAGLRFCGASFQQIGRDFSGVSLEAAMSSQPLLGCQGKTLSTQDESCELRFHHAPRMPCELLFNQLASYKLRCGLQG
ncbi:hypothetical protein, partial [Pseudomonas aeruginosa]